MPKTVLSLTRDSWKEFKVKHNLSKSSIFKKADVGPTIEKLEKAQKDFLSAPSMKSSQSYFKQIGTLSKAMKKFVALKTDKGELHEGDAAMKQIEKWVAELKVYEVQVAKFIKNHQAALEDEDKKKMQAQFKDEFGIG